MGREDFGVATLLSERGLVCGAAGAANDADEARDDGDFLPLSDGFLSRLASMPSPAGDLRPKRSRKPRPGSMAAGSRYGRLAMDALRSSGLDEAAEADSAGLLVAVGVGVLAPRRYVSSC